MVKKCYTPVINNTFLTLKVIDIIYLSRTTEIFALADKVVPDVWKRCSSNYAWTGQRLKEV